MLERLIMFLKGYQCEVIENELNSTDALHVHEKMMENAEGHYLSLGYHVVTKVHDTGSRLIAYIYYRK